MKQFVFKTLKSLTFQFQFRKILLSKSPLRPRTPSKIDIENFASLYVGVCKPDKNGLNDGKPSTHFYAQIHIISF